MKKFFFFGLLFSILALCWCNWLNTKKYDIMFNDDFFDWFTWQIIIVDDSNKFDKFVQTWKQLLYINKNFGFYTIFWDEFLNTEIIQKINNWTPYIEFTFKWNDSFYDFSVNLTVLTSNKYLEDQYRQSIWKIAENNKYIFLSDWGSFSHDFIDYHFPSFGCRHENYYWDIYTIICDDWVEKLFGWLTAFNI